MIAGGPQAAAILAGLLLAGCFQQTGDLGRRHDNIITGTLLPRAGQLAAAMRGEPMSVHPLTDDEEELRRRAWHFLMPGHEEAVFRMRLSELAYTRVLPPFPYHGRQAYHATLMAGPFRSVASRYRRLADDIDADRQLVDPFTRVAARVCQADRVRSQAIPHVAHLDPHTHEHALARIAENALLVAWVRAEIVRRGEAWRYTLEHLVLEGPQREALLAERALLSFERHLQVLAARDACGAAGEAQFGASPPATRGGAEFHPASPPPSRTRDRPELPPK